MHAVSLTTVLNTASLNWSNQTHATAQAAYTVGYYEAPKMEAPTDPDGDAYWSALASETEANYVTFWAD